MAVQNPVHFDIVGSFLRPERLKKAREAFRSGALGQAGLRRVEDEEIRKLISKEKALGLRTLTDGEFRREYWHLDFMWGLGGIKRETLSMAISSKGRKQAGIQQSLRESFLGTIIPSSMISALPNSLPIKIQW